MLNLKNCAVTIQFIIIIIQNRAAELWQIMIILVSIEIIMNMITLK